MARQMNGDPDRKSSGTKPTYDQSVKVRDPGGSNISRPNPSTPYRDPNPGSRILNDRFDKGSR